MLTPAEILHTKCLRTSAGLRLRQGDSSFGLWPVFTHREVLGRGDNVEFKLPLPQHCFSFKCAYFIHRTTNHLHQRGFLEASGPTPPSSNAHHTRLCRPYIQSNFKHFPQEQTLIPQTLPYVMFSSPRPSQIWHHPTTGSKCTWSHCFGH